MMTPTFKMMIMIDMIMISIMKTLDMTGSLSSPGSNIQDDVLTLHGLLTDTDIILKKIATSHVMRNCVLSWDKVQNVLLMSS